MLYWLFEDQKYVNFLPLVYFRPIWNLWVGAGTLLEKWKDVVPVQKGWARSYLHQPVLSNPAPGSDELTNENAIFILARMWPLEFTAAKLEKLAPGEVLTTGDEVVAFRGGPAFGNCVTGDLIDTRKIMEQATSVQQTSVTLLQFIWDLIDINPAALVHDFHTKSPRGINGNVHPSASLIQEDSITVAPTARVGAQVVLDASEGPIWIDDGATVMHNSVIVGPAYVGKESTIKIGAKIYENTALGPVCKIGGEVEGTIVQGYSNKQHDGFLGHAYLGSWVNLGADTNNSDLKNNYGPITVFLNGRPVQTGKQFLGLIMGDHSKTGINTMFNTGTVVGVNCNIFGAEMPPKFVPSFSWGGGGTGFQPYRLDKAMDVARVVMGRRNVPFTDKTAQLFKSVYALSQQLELRSENE